MAWLICTYASPKRHAKQVKITKAVKNLMFYKFAFAAQTSLIQNRPIINNNGIIKRAAACKKVLVTAPHLSADIPEGFRSTLHKARRQSQV